MKPTHLIGKMLLIFLFTTVFSAVSHGIAAEKSSEKNVAIKGYDPVAYFLDNRAVRGDQSFNAKWHNLTWYFQNQKHLDLFTSNPEKYAPQYDGFCAWAMTESRKAITDPEVWKIVNGKLYLNCSLTAYEKWSRDIPGNIKKADANWARLNKAN